MRIRIFIAFSLIPQILAVNYLRNNPSIIDEYYVDYFYKGIFKVNSFIFSGINFPIGEVLYISIVLSFIYFIYKAFSFRFNDLINLISFISVTYFIFYSFWGLNYFRTSISEELKIKSDYEFVELDSTIKKVISQIEKEVSLLDIEINSSNIYELTNTSNSNIKKSIIPYIYLYQRVSGHYIPFTSEAVFIGDIPIVDIPVVIYHEQAHQKGYADEAEASFIAFSKAINNQDPYIRYSGYFMALTNLLHEVNINHPEEINLYIRKLDEKVKNDMNLRSKFWNRYSNNIFDKITNYIYDFYLKSNDQKAGIMSYNKVSNYIIAYYQNEQLSKIFN